MLDIYFDAFIIAMVIYVILDVQLKIHFFRGILVRIRHYLWMMSKPDIPKLLRKAQKDYLKCLDYDEDFEKKRKIQLQSEWVDYNELDKEDEFRKNAIETIRRLIKKDGYNKGLLYLQVSKYLCGNNKPLTLYEISIATIKFRKNPEELYDLFFLIHQINK